MNNAPWKAHLGAKEGNDFPVVGVSWDDAMKFCRKLTDQEQRAGRLPEDWQYTLPTEAQWERSCRAKTETKFSFGDDESQLGDYGWYNMNCLGAGEPFAHRVGQKKANAWGLHDMHGNVWEWCRDQHGSRLPGGRDPEVREGGIGHTVRGGSFDDSPVWCRSAYRPLPGSNDEPKAAFIGFRVALAPVRQAAASEPRP